MRGLAVLLLAAGAALGGDGCAVARGPRIKAGELAAVAPALGAIPAERDFGYAPLPGMTRVIRALELRRWAGMDTGSGGICVRREAFPVPSSEVKEALRAVLPAGASLEVLDYLRTPLPRGRLAFEAANLPRTRPGIALQEMVWRGRMVFDETRSAPFWARVRVTCAHRAVRAARPIAAGATLKPDDLAESVEARGQCGLPDGLTAREAGGMQARRGIEAGTEIRKELLAAPGVVKRGDRVAVRVEAGEARLGFEGIALTGGREGASAVVKNEMTGARLQGRIEGPGRVTVRLEARRGPQRP
jgi:flagella basal body P-ring formation protein FlgA